jgi:hypothetical protein
MDLGGVMAFWKKKRKKQASKPASQTGPRKGGKRTPLELKLAADVGLHGGLAGRGSGLSAWEEA